MRVSIVACGILTVALALFAFVWDNADGAPVGPPDYKLCSDGFPAPRTSIAAAALADCLNKIAQARYAEEQRGELLSRPRGLLGWLAAYGVALGAITAGLVGLLSFVNARAAGLRQEEQTQLYEALKRLADSDSRALRAGAAGLLLALAVASPLKTGRIRAGRRWLSRSERRFTTIFDQLAFALLLEHDDNVVTVIEQILTTMTQVYGYDLREFLNTRLQTLQDRLSDEGLIDAIAIAVATSGLSTETETLAVIAERTGVAVDRLKQIIGAQNRRYKGLIDLCTQLEVKELLALRKTAYESLDSFRLRTGAFSRIIDPPRWILK